MDYFNMIKNSMNGGGNSGTNPKANSGNTDYFNLIKSGEFKYTPPTTQNNSQQPMRTVVNKNEPIKNYESGRISDEKFSKIQSLDAQIEELTKKMNSVSKNKLNNQTGLYNSPNKGLPTLNMNNEYQELLKQRNELSKQKSEYLKDGDTLLGNVASGGLGLLEGFLNTTEGIADLGQYGLANIANIFGLDDARDALIDNASANSTDMLTGWTDKYLNDITDPILQRGAIGRQVTQGVGQAGTMMLGSAALGPLGTLNLGPLSLPTTAILSGAGSSQSEAINDGATLGQSNIYGGLSGLTTGLTESLFGTQLPGKLGKTLSGAFGGNKTIDGAINHVVSKVFKSTVGQNVVKNIISTLGEGGEEVIEGFISPFLKRLSYDEKAELYTKKEAWNDFIVGSLTSLLTQSPVMIATIKQNNPDFQNKTDDEIISEIANKIPAPTDNDVLKTAIEETMQQPTVTEPLTQETTTLKTDRLDRLNDELTQNKTELENARQTGDTELVEILENEVGKLTTKYNREVTKNEIETFKQSNTFKSLEEFGSRTGTKIEIVREDGNIEGSYNPETKTLSVNLKSNNLNGVIAHEVIHTLRETKGYNKIQDYLFKVYSKEIDSIKSELQGIYTNLSDNQLNEEVVAKLIQNNINKPQTIQTLLNTNRTMFDKIYDFIKGLKESVTGTQYEPSVKKLERLFAKAIDEKKTTPNKEVVETKTEVVKKVTPKKEVVETKTEVVKPKKEVVKKVTPKKEVIETKQEVVKPKNETSKDDFIKSLQSARNKINNNQTEIMSNNELDSILKKDNVKLSLVGVDTLNLEQKRNVILAEKMEKSGKSTSDIWNRTGLYRNVSDGRWRVEIADGTLKKVDIDTSKKQLKLADIWEAKELFKKYPQLKDVKIEMVSLPPNMVASYFDNVIEVNRNRKNKDAKYLRSVLSHEIQHAVQDIEGFATGSSPQFFDSLVNLYGLDKSQYTKQDYTRYYENVAGEIEASMVQDRLNLDEHDRNFIAPNLEMKLPKGETVISMEQTLADVRKSFGEVGVKKLLEGANKSSLEIINKYSNKTYEDKVETLGLSELNIDKDFQKVSTLKMSSRDTKRAIEIMFDSKNLKNNKTFHLVHNMYSQMVNNAAAKIRVTNEMFNEVRDVKLKRNSDISKGIMKYGEGGYTNTNGKFVDYTLKDLQKEFPNDWRKMTKTERVMRKWFDWTHARINEVLVANGEEAIPYRKDYFHHFNDVETTKMFDILSKVTGLNLTAEGIVDTSSVRPDRAFFSALMKRKGKDTKIDAFGSFEKYMYGALNVVFHTTDVQNFRTMENYLTNMVESKKMGFIDDDMDSNNLSRISKWFGNQANILAGIDSSLDKAFKEVFGSEKINNLNAVSQWVNARLISGNIKSALKNIHVVPVAAVISGNPKAVGNALKKTISSKFYNDGLLKQSNQSTLRKGIDPLTKGGLISQITDSGFIPHDIIDRVSTEIVFRIGYENAISNKHSHEKAIQLADDFTTRTMGGRGKIERPQITVSKVASITPFVLEPLNNIRRLTHDTKYIDFADVKNVKQTKDNAQSQYMVYHALSLLVAMALVGELEEELYGVKQEFNPLGLMIDGFNRLNNENLTTEEAIFKTVYDGVSQLPYTNVLLGEGTVLQGQLPQLQNISGGRSSFTKEITKLGKLAFPTGGQTAYNIYDAVNNLYKDGREPGSYTKDGKLQFPVKDDPASVVKNAFFGKWSTKEGQQYIENNWGAIGTKQTDAFFKSKLPMNEFRKYVGKINSFESNKNSKGNSIPGSLKDKKEKYIKSLPINHDAKKALTKYIED